jgi:hypothetical protein
MGWSFTDIVETVAGGLGYEAFFAGDRRAARAQRRAHRAEAESRRVGAAQSENERRAAIRQQAREERIRRAQILSAGEAAGVSGSSVEASNIGSGQTLAAAGQAFSSGATLSANIQSNLLQGAADFRSQGAQAMARQQMFRTAFDLSAKAITGGAA